MLSSTNLVIILGMTQISNRIPMEDPNILMAIRAVYIFSNLIIAGIYLYIQSKINAKKGTCSGHASIFPSRSPRKGDH